MLFGPVIKSAKRKYQTAEPQSLCQHVEYNTFYLDKELASGLPRRRPGRSAGADRRGRRMPNDAGITKFQ